MVDEPQTGSTQKELSLDDYADMLFPVPQNQPDADESFQITTKQVIDIEIKMYLENPPDKTIDPFEWWRNNITRFPKLGLLAQKYLCSPPSSVNSERLFSIGGNIMTARRSRLKPENGEMLMYLAHNLRALNFDN